LTRSGVVTGLSKALERARMTRKTPSEFTSHDDWLSYVRREIAVSDRPYALACGRVELFRSFYGMQGHEFPAPFAAEFERIGEMHDREQTAALETLNKAILANLTQLLADQSRPSLSASDPLARRSSREQIHQLRSHLVLKNPYFALWTVYKNGEREQFITEDWHQFLLQQLGTECTEEIEFTRAMAELDKLLTLFHDEHRDLPGLSFERIWFLHYLQGPERMLQTFAVLGMLAAELATCTSA
jgi:hypothetical protein